MITLALVKGSIGDIKPVSERGSLFPREPNDCSVWRKLMRGLFTECLCLPKMPMMKPYTPMWWYKEADPLGSNIRLDGATRVELSWKGWVSLSESWKILLSLPTLHHVRIHWEVGSATGRRVLTRTWPCWHPDLRPPTSRTVRNKFL